MARVTKMVKQMLLHTCSSLTMLSRVTFMIVPSWQELANSLPNILHSTLILGQKVDDIFGGISLLLHKKTCAKGTIVAKQ